MGTSFSSNNTFFPYKNKVEDLESSMEDILASFFHTLYLWMVAFSSPLPISFANFLVRFSIPI
jgi:hypothetical protein